ncbi:MAG: AAA family ATPase [Leptospiraceae bacterium]|nr:AAA family ATPase [Leptospiraceae bacterium]
MGGTLSDIAQQLKDANKKVQLIYAFNGAGKTRLSREFKKLITPNSDSEEHGDAVDSWLARDKILYYNAFTEDLFYWDNDLVNDTDPKLKIQPNSFTDWILVDQGQDRNIVTKFQSYTNDKLTPKFNQEYTIRESNGSERVIKANSEVTFSMQRGDDEDSGNIKISKGEESLFIWSIFYSILDLIIGLLNENQNAPLFSQLEYVFIDDPVSSLDENHLIDLAINLGRLIKSCNTNKLRFIITTHNPLFFNVLHNEFSNGNKYILKKEDDGTHELIPQKSDSPFSYHLLLKSELKKATNGQLYKYHFNLLRNILEKTSTFIGYEKWGDLLPLVEGGQENPYARIINFYNHSSHSSEEVAEVTDDHKRVFNFLVRKLDEMYLLKMRSE